MANIWYSCVLLSGSTTTSCRMGFASEMMLKSLFWWLVWSAHWSSRWGIYYQWFSRQSVGSWPCLVWKWQSGRSWTWRLMGVAMCSIVKHFPMNWIWVEGDALNLITVLQKNPLCWVQYIVFWCDTAAEEIPEVANLTYFEWARVTSVLIWWLSMDNRLQISCSCLIFLLIWLA